MCEFAAHTFTRDTSTLLDLILLFLLCNTSVACNGLTRNGVRYRLRKWNPLHLVKLTSFPMAWTPDVGMSESVQRYAESTERGVCVTVQYACKGHAVYWDINIMVCLHMWQKQTVLESPSHLSEGPQQHDMIWVHQ